MNYFPTLIRIRNFKWGSVQHIVDFAFDPENRIISPAQIKEEALNFLTLISGRDIRTVLEIGSANGGTLFMIAKTVKPDAKIISLDYGYTKFGGLMLLAKRVLFASFLPTGKVTLINADSHKDETLLKVIREASKLDLLFIDGDHSYEGVKQDFKMYKPLVNQGGLIAFHDIVEHTPGSDCNVKKLWDEIKNDFDYIEIIDNHDQGGFGIGVLINREPIQA